MINKKKFLGKNPDELGVKDAIHVAIVSCIAGQAIKGGGRVMLNKDGQAINASCNSGFGVADPFIGQIARGEHFWAMVDPQEVATVAHTWDHPVQFTASPAPVKKNACLDEVATLLGVTYEQLMHACGSYVRTDRKAPYPGNLTVDAGEEIIEKEIEISDMWYEWANESGYEFENMGSECCPEYEYPDDVPFEWV